jgi:glutamate dehydrogenase (NAD(P)+)
VQNIQQFAWDETRVRVELERIMRAAFASLTKSSAIHRVDLRTAAFIVAIERVARATAQRGL